VSRFEILTYEHEYIRAEPGEIVRLDIVGRLDVFAAEALVDALQSLPDTCGALLDLRTATDSSEAGFRLLEEHLHSTMSCDRVVVVLDSDRCWGSRLHSGIRLTTKQDEALSILRSSLESGGATVPLLVSARTVGGRRPEKRCPTVAASADDPMQLSAGKPVPAGQESVWAHLRRHLPFMRSRGGRDHLGK
jgi:hypothetical protein